MRLITSVSAYLGLDEPTVLHLAAVAPNTYKQYSVPKATGGRRTIHQPSSQTKSLQYALIDLLLRQAPIHGSAAAYVPGKKSPLLQNAMLHARFAYSVRLDFKDFFPSICSQDLLTRLRAVPIPLDMNEEYFVASALFVGQPNGSTGLAIGAPASPLTCNIVMYGLDAEFAAFASKTGGIYSRYADDLVYSTDQKGVCLEFGEFVRSRLSSITSPVLHLNSKKTQFMSRSTRRVITGLYITPTGCASIGRVNKRYIRKLLFSLRSGKLPDKGRSYLRGYLAYILDVEPDLYNRLALKYGAALLADALHGAPIGHHAAETGAA